MNQAVEGVQGMAATESTARRSEALVTKGGLSLRFLFNHRTGAMRIIDFRAGAHPEKLSLVQEVAAQEGMQRAYTLVEREEAPTWTRMGFSKEGTIPGFYKRSDAHVLGVVLDQLPGKESAIRIRVGARDQKPDRLDRIYQAARKSVRARAGAALPRVKVSRARDQDSQRAMAQAQASGRDLTDFSPFGRDVDRRFYLLTARGGFSLLVGVEIQPCFDNAFLELLTPPRGEKELWMMAGGLSQLCEKLVEEGIVSVFSTTPADSLEMTTILLGAGFKKTGLLPQQLAVAGKPVAAQLWSRKLSEPA